jgi:hypothetical protein
VGEASLLRPVPRISGAGLSSLESRAVAIYIAWVNGYPRERRLQERSRRFPTTRSARLAVRTEQRLAPRLDMATHGLEWVGPAVRHRANASEESSPEPRSIGIVRAECASIGDSIPDQCADAVHSRERAWRSSVHSNSWALAWPVSDFGTCNWLSTGEPGRGVQR